MTVPNPQEDNQLVSKTEWRRRGFKVKAGEEPRGVASAVMGGRRRQWLVYGKDQVEAVAKRVSRRAKKIDCLAAVWVINRYAKRCRDAAKRCYALRNHAMASRMSRQKTWAYFLKSQAIEYLVKDGLLAVVGHHRFGENWAEVLSDGRYTYHRPCLPPVSINGPVTELDDIEAKPRGSREPRLKDALHTIERYLAGKPIVVVYSWPTRRRREPYDYWDDDMVDADSDGYND